MVSLGAENLMTFNLSDNVIMSKICHFCGAINLRPNSTVGILRRMREVEEENEWETGERRTLRTVDYHKDSRQHLSVHRCHFITLFEPKHRPTVSHCGRSVIEFRQAKWGAEICKDDGTKASRRSTDKGEALESVYVEQSVHSFIPMYLWKQTWQTGLCLNSVNIKSASNFTENTTFFFMNLVLASSQDGRRPVLGLEVFWSDGCHLMVNTVSATLNW